MMKRCTRCGIEKPLTEFHKARSSTGAASPRGGMGVEARCKDCKAEDRKPGISAARRDVEELRRQGLRKCGACAVVKPISAFHVRRASRDGLAHKCAECVNAYTINWKGKNPGAFKGWYSENRERRAEYWKEWYEANRDRRAESLAKWASANKHTVNTLIAKRNAAKLKATPLWADQNAIRDIYKKAAELTAKTGIRHDVDHIYPLQGETVCGLHCESNLQILTKTENIRKGNRMPEECG